MNNLINNINLTMKELAVFIIENYRDKKFNTIQLRKALKKKYNLSSNSKLVVIAYIEKRRKIKCIKCENLLTPLTLLNNYKTITLLEKKKNKNNITTKRVFRVNYELLDEKDKKALCEAHHSLDDEIKCLLKAQ